MESMESIEHPLDPALPTFASFLPQHPLEPGTEQITLPLANWESWWTQEQTKRLWRIQTVRDERRDPNRARKERSRKAREEKAMKGSKPDDKFSPYNALNEKSLGGAKKKYDWTRSYVCSRWGQPRTKKSGSANSPSNTPFDANLKIPGGESQRVGCKARLVVHKLCGQEMLQITRCDLHTGHDPDADIRDDWARLSVGRSMPMASTSQQAVTPQTMDTFGHTEATIGMQMEQDIPVGVEGDHDGLESYLDPFLNGPEETEDPDWRLTREALVEQLKILGNAVRDVSNWDGARVTTQEMREMIKETDRLKAMLRV